MLQGIHLLDLARDYRLTLPRAWREQFPDGEAVVTVAHDPAWLIYPTAPSKRAPAFAANPPYKLGNPLALSRPGPAPTIDPRGRLRIPASRARLRRTLLPLLHGLVGLGHWAELWRAEQWELEMDKIVNAPCPPWMQELMDNDPLM